MNPSSMASTRMADFLRWGADARGSTRPLALMRIAIATIVFVRFANEVSLYQGDSLSFVLLGLVFFGLTSTMLVGFKAQASCAGVALTLMTMHFYMGKVHGYPGLFVADGSVVPTSIGFHPAMTISALSEYIAEAVIDSYPAA